VPPAPDQPTPPPDAALGPELAHLDAVLRQLAVGVLVADPDGRVVAVNDRARAILGVDATPGAAPADAGRWRAYRPDGRAYADDELPLPRAVRRGEAVAAERIVLERPDGTRVAANVSAAPVRDAAGRVVAAAAVIDDAPAREAADAAARDAAARTRRLQRVTAALAEPLTREQVAAVFAAELPEALGTVYAWLAAVSDDGREFEVLAARDRDGAVPDAWRRIPTDGPTVVAAVRADGRPRAFRSRAALLAERPELADSLPPGHEAALALPLRNDSRVLAVAWLAFATPRDFTAEELALAEALAAQCASALERARLYQEERTLRAEAERQRAVAQAAQRAAEEAARTKSDFMATMSHELRTPLNAIAGYAQLLDLEVAGPLTPQQRDYLSRLAASGQHLLGLVNDVLDLAKLDAGRVIVARDPQRAASAAAAVLAVVLPLAEAKRVRLVDAAGAEADAGYVGDEHRVRQVLINLLSNAIKFTPAGGTVELTCARHVEAPPAARLAGGGPWLAIGVRDTGIGIAPERQPSVFEPFVQAEAGHTRRHGGTGLGLTISRRLARLMGGDLTVESAPGRGSTFTLWLPALPAGAPADASAGPEGAARVAADEAPAGAADAAAAGAPRAGREVAGPRVHGLREVADQLREHLEGVLARYVDRMRGDPALADVAGDRARIDLEDHTLAFVGDLVQSLAVLDGGAEGERTLLQDGADVQRLLAERHGRQRFRLGFTAEQVAREYVLLGEELDALVRRLVPPEAGDVDAALATLARLVRRAGEHAARGHRRAAFEVTGEHAAAAGRPRGRG
jgi:PAS domain S-box-containing protein